MRDLELIKKIDTKTIYKEYCDNVSLLRQGKFYYQPSHNDLKFLELVTYSLHNKEKGARYLLGDELRTEITEEAELFPELMGVLLSFAKERKSYLSRSVIASLNNESQYYPHVDTGFFYILHNRHHLVISSPESSMMVNHKEVFFTTGDMFYINNKDIHSGKNALQNSMRVHVIFDLLPRDPLAIIRNYMHWFLYKRTKYTTNPSLLESVLGIRYVFLAIFLSLFTYRNRYKTGLPVAVNF